MVSIGTFRLDESEVAKRKAYLELTGDDERRLRDAHPHLQRQAGPIIERFYAYLLAHEATRTMLEAPGLLERLKGLQARYFSELTGGAYDLPYCENRVRVGLVHQKIGLSPEWYLGAYVKYLHIASDVLSTAFGRDYERFYQTIVSLTKVIYLDMGLALDAYHFSAQDGLERTNDELRRAQAARQQLTDMIVHDLQNPLTGIHTALQMLASGATSLSGGERDAVQEALRRCNDLSQMILDVLQVSRAATSEIPVLADVHDLAALARASVDAFRRTAGAEGRSIELEGADALEARTDASLVRRILQNLLRNAIRHTPRGTRVAVAVGRSAEGRPQLAVRDDGPGIRPEMHAQLFEPGGAAALRHSGVRVDTGLGLPTCRILARALGGEIRVESDGVKGCSFVLEL